jgi:hypothetical protein
MSTAIPPRQPSAVSSRHQKVRPAIVDVAPIVLATVVVLWLTWSARAKDAGLTQELSGGAVSAVIIGGFGNALLFSWFQAGELKRRSNLSYVIPAWAPQRVAVVFVLLGWAAALLCSYWLGLSWSRR